MVVQGSLSVGVYKYARPDSLPDWIVVFKVAHGASYKRQSAIEATAAADQQAPIFLSRQETYDYVASVWLKNGVNKKLDSSILQVMMPDVTYPTYADATGYEKMLYISIQRLIIQGNNVNDEDELSLISDMRQFNIRENNKTSEFDLYWKAAIIVTDTESTHGAYERRHAAGDSDATNRLSHDTLIYTNHIIKSTIQLIEKYGLKQGVDLKVPSNIWVSLQFTSNNGQQRTAERYTVRLNFFRALQTRELRDDHPHGNYNENMKQLWRWNMAHLHDLVEEDCTITSSTIFVDS